MVNTNNNNNNSRGGSARRGSLVTNKKPNYERLFRWFGAKGDVKGDGTDQFVRCLMLKDEFNHDICGITNPLIRIKTKTKMLKQQQRQLVSNNDPANDVVTKCDDNDDDDDDEGIHSIDQSWWPFFQFDIDEETDLRTGIHRKSGKSRIFVDKEEWRILRYRKRVGRGEKCYKQVRDAALDWEFQSADLSMGMMEIPALYPRCDNGILKSSKHEVDASDRRPIIDGSGSTRSLSSYRSLGSRRLISFSSKSVPFQQRIYAINPVLVVYDVVDQRAPCDVGATLFTSTAYSTLKGHLLRGEERVTVALRDGSQYVDVEILSISRAGSGFAGKILWPFIGNMQNAFFNQQLEHLAAYGFDNKRCSSIKE